MIKKMKLGVKNRKLNRYKIEKQEMNRGPAGLSQEKMKNDLIGQFPCQIQHNILISSSFLSDVVPRGFQYLSKKATRLRALTYFLIKFLVRTLPAGNPISFPRTRKIQLYQVFIYRLNQIINILSLNLIGLIHLICILFCNYISVLIDC